MEHHGGFGCPAADAEGATTEHPERELQPEENLMGAAPAEEKKGIVGRVKGMMAGHGRKKHGDHNEDAIPATGETDPAGFKCTDILHKIKGKAENKVGHGEDDTTNASARVVSMARSDSMSPEEEEIGTVGFAMDPTGPAVAGQNLGREDFTSAPVGPGADLSHPTLKPDDDNGDELDQHAERAVEFAKASNPLNPKYAHMRNSALTPSEGDTDVASHRSLLTETSNSSLTPSAQADDGQLLDHSHFFETDNSSNQAASEPHPSDSEAETGTVERDHQHFGHHGHHGYHGDNVTETFMHKVTNRIH